MSKAVKILVVGDGAVGKTCLAKMFVDGVMPSDYNPTVFENHSVKLSFEEDVSLMHASLRTDRRAKCKRQQCNHLPLPRFKAHDCCLQFAFGTPIIAKRSVHQCILSYIY